MNSDNVTITIIVDNFTRNGMLCEHGFSVQVYFRGRRFLLDTGMGEAFPANVEKLGLDMGRLDGLVLSHGHYDHTGNVPYVLSKAPDINVYAHPDIMRTRYSIRDRTPKDISIPRNAKDVLEAPGRALKFNTGPVNLTRDCGITGEVPRVTLFEDTGGPFYLDTHETRKDLIEDDQSIWFRTPAGLVILAGCCHSGIINTINHVRRISGGNRVHAIVGGFHLKEAGSERLSRTAAELKRLDPAHIVPCHCTGDEAVEFLKQEFGDRVRPGYSGAVFNFGSTD